MELLEREQFFDELEAILSDVAGGNGRFVLVTGEAGIGKTSLVECFAEANKQNARISGGLVMLCSRRVPSALSTI